MKLCMKYYVQMHGQHKFQQESWNWLADGLYNNNNIIIINNSITFSQRSCLKHLQDDQV